MPLCFKIYAQTGKLLLNVYNFRLTLDSQFMVVVNINDVIMFILLFNK